MHINDTNANQSFNQPLGLDENPGPYTVIEIVLASILVVIVIIEIVAGNCLVIVAIVKDRTLHMIQNWFVASLATADLCVALTIMPLSLATEMMGYWYFGAVLCEFWLSVDVLLCTASIWSLCMISLDRYWSVTTPVTYTVDVRRKWAKGMIIAAWILAVIICVPSLIGWKTKKDFSVAYPQCILSEELTYIIYSTCGSFYIPLIIIVFVNIRIGLKARSMAQRTMGKGKLRAFKSNPQSTDQTRLEKQKAELSEAARKHPECSTFPPVIEVCDASTKEANQSAQQPNHNIGPFSPQESFKTIDSPDTDAESPRRILNVELSPKVTRDSPRTRDRLKDRILNSLRKASLKTKSEETEAAVWDSEANEDMNKGFTRTALLAASMLTPPGSTPMTVSAPVSPEHRTDNGNESQKLLTRHGSGTSGGATKISRAKTDRRINLYSVFVKRLQSHGADSDHNDPEERRRRAARARERRATLVIGIVMATFIGCWFPFFTLYVIDTILYRTDTGHRIPGVVFKIFFWLGYCNSGCNPIIYTVFNRDFKHAFKRLLGMST